MLEIVMTLAVPVALAIFVIAGVIRLGMVPLKRRAARRNALPAPYEKYAVMPGKKGVPRVEVVGVDDAMCVGVIVAKPEGFTAEMLPRGRGAWAATRPTIDEAARALIDHQEETQRKFREQEHSPEEQEHSPEEQARRANVAELLEFKKAARRR